MSNREVVDAYARYLTEIAADPGNTQPSQELLALVESADAAGEFGFGGAPAAAGHSGPLDVTWEATPSNPDFTPHAVTVCGVLDEASGDPVYVEIERASVSTPGPDCPPPVPCGTCGAPLGSAGSVGSLGELAIGSAAALTQLAAGSARATGALPGSPNPCGGGIIIAGGT